MIKNIKAITEEVKNLKVIDHDSNYLFYFQITKTRV